MTAAPAQEEPDPLAPQPRIPPEAKTQITRLSYRDTALLIQNADILDTTETDAVRRAIRHSHWLLTLPDKGRTLLVRDESTGKTTEVIILT